MAEALLSGLDVAPIGREALHLTAKPQTVRRRGPAACLARGPCWALARRCA